MSAGSIFWVVVIAGFGGVLVLVGLLMERFSEKERYNNLRAFKLSKSVKVAGEWLVIIGIAIEIGAAVDSAIDIRQTRRLAIKNDPLNQPINTVGAQALLVFSEKNFPKDPFRSTWLMVSDFSTITTHKPNALLSPRSILLPEPSTPPGGDKIVQMEFAEIAGENFEGKVRDLAKWNVVELLMPGFVNCRGLESGFVTISVNGGTRTRTYVFPPQAVNTNLARAATTFSTVVTNGHFQVGQW